MEQAGDLGRGVVVSTASARLRGGCAAHREAALRLVDRVDAERWRFELQLPAWLGADTGIARPVVVELAASNLIGLAALRLVDDAVDGELGDEGLDAAAIDSLSECMLDSALEPYRRTFDAGSEFWTYESAALEAWRAATENGAASRPDGGALAARAAPAKVAAIAICLLGGRRQLLRELDACLDHALMAMVLHDHAVDWPADLRAGRWNALADHLGATTPADVAVGLMVGRRFDDYYGGVRAEFDAAVTDARRLGLPALSEGIAALAATIDDYARRVTGRFALAGERASLLLMGAGQ